MENCRDVVSHWITQSCKGVNLVEEARRGDIWMVETLRREVLKSHGPLDLVDLQGG